MVARSVVAAHRSRGRTPNHARRAGDLIAPDPAEDHFAAVVPNAIARCSIHIVAVRSASSVLAVLNEEAVAEKTAREYGLADFRRGAPISSVVGRLDDAGVPGFLNETLRARP